MMKTIGMNNRFRQAGALMAALLLALATLCGGINVRAEFMSQLSYTLMWETGMVQSSPINAPGYEDSSWLYIPYDAIIADAQLTAADAWGQYARLILPDGRERFSFNIRSWQQEANFCEKDGNHDSGHTDRPGGSLSGIG